MASSSGNAEANASQFSESERQDIARIVAVIYAQARQEHQAFELLNPPRPVQAAALGPDRHRNDDVGFFDRR
jgi:hypothetical protein